MPLPSLKTIKWVTTDCYGTLIDWEKGIVDACKKEAEKDGFSFEEGPFLARFMEVQAEIMAGSYELYAEVLRRTIVKVAGELGWEIEPSRAQFLPNSVAYWLPFREANAAMDRLGKKYEVGIISNVDDKLLGISAPPAHRTRPRRHRAAGPQLQARPRPLQRVRAADRRQERLAAHRLRLHQRCRPPAEDERAGHLGQPPRREAGGPQSAERHGQKLPRGGEKARRVLSIF
jgi:Predicted hydrolase (HAD superfamily)